MPRPQAEDQFSHKLPKSTMLHRIAKLVNDAGGPVAFAEKHGYTAEYIRWVMQWKTMTPPSYILGLIGVRRMRKTVYIYEEIP